jgi:Tfp pilus assembly protein PilF
MSMGKDAPPMGNNTTPDVVEIGSHLLAARVYAASGEKVMAIDELKKAVAGQDKLTYDEPPPWPWSMREELGAGLMANGDLRGARDVFREDLRRHPNNPRSMRGLAECEASLTRQAGAQ